MGKRMRWTWIAAIAAVLLVGGGVAGCAAVFPAVKLDPTLGPPAPPPLLGAFEGDAPVATRADWETRRAPLLRRLFAERVYGPYPPITSAPRVLTRSAIAYAPLEDVATVEQWSVTADDEDAPPHFNMVLVLPKNAQGPTPILIMENFCGNHAAFRDPPPQIAGPLTEVLWACNSQIAAPIVEGILGANISVPPYRDIIAHGYGVAMFYAGDVVADEPIAARAGLRQLYGDHAEHAGAIAVWAWLFSRAYDVLAEDPRIDAHRVAIWGHSRNGKAALLAAALDPRIAAVIAHQSGRGGASLRAGTEGETPAKLMTEFPHWFPPQFATTQGEPAFDQHQLLALIAPRPMLLGNGARDAWSDPHAAFRAAQAASPAYQLYGATGFAQTDMTTPNLDANLAYFTRPGIHGITSHDWQVFLAFLDAHFKAQSAAH